MPLHCAPRQGLRHPRHVHMAIDAEHIFVAAGLPTAPVQFQFKRLITVLDKDAGVFNVLAVFGVTQTAAAAHLGFTFVTGRSETRAAFGSGIKFNRAFALDLQQWAIIQLRHIFGFRLLAISP